MIKKHNFSAGPAILPSEVMAEAAQAVVNFDDLGLSLLEISHRSPAFVSVMDEAASLLKELLGLGDDFEVLFLTGGASSQFFMVPANFLGEGEAAGYSNTGTWADKAIKEAKLYGHVHVLASSKEANYTYIPRDYEIPAELKYFHFTSNNTIFGTEYHWLPETNVPLVCDMSSDFLSRPLVDAQKYGLIYAGAQKNLGPAGVTVVLVKKDFLANRKANRKLPTMLQYDTHVKEGSMFNTPPVFPIYVSMLTLRWLKKMGGLAAIATYNQQKAQVLYQEIDRNSMFEGTTAVADRSLMNVCFVLKNAAHDAAFLEACEAVGCTDLKGHRSVGGFRASIYNAMPIESVEVLAKVMRDFEQKNG